MIYSVIVKPGSKKGPLIVSSGDELTIYLHEKPIEGQANAALVKLLSDHFHIPKTSIQIKSGARGRRKLVEIPDSC